MAMVWFLDVIRTGAGVAGLRRFAHVAAVLTVIATVLPPATPAHAQATERAIAPVIANPENARGASGQRQADQTGATAQAPASRLAQPRSKKRRSFRDCALCPEMVVVPPGRFIMGSPEDEERSGYNERPQRSESIRKAFAVGKYEVTFAEWDACVASGGCNGYKPADEGWGRGKRPVINVSWNDAQAYVKWLSKRTGKRYRLLSETEWEYAARGRTKGRYSNDAGPAELCRIANHADLSVDYREKNTSCSDGVGKQTSVVGAYESNSFGLHDVHGNVWEWAADCYEVTLFKIPQHWTAWQKGECDSRALRGGSWRWDHAWVRSAVRFFGHSEDRSADVGFRVARGL
jgi:formylglycine-generating enzyme required for sulfatase activity